MSAKQSPTPWYKIFSRPYESGRDDIASVIAKAEASFDSSRYHELIELIEGVIAKRTASAEDEAILRCLLNEALCELSRYNEAAAALARYEADKISFPEKLQAELLLRIGATCSWLGQYPKSIAKLNEAIRIFTTLSDDEGITRGYFELSRVYININEYKIAGDYLSRSLAGAEHLANRRLSAQILLRVGMVAHFEGDFANAKLHYRRALKMVEGGCDYRLLGSLQMDLASTLFYDEHSSAESAEQIISFNESAIENFKKLPNYDAMANCCNNLGDALLRFGHWNKAEEALKQAIETARTANHTYSEGLAFITLGELNIRRGDLATAKRLLVSAIKIFEQADKGALAHAKRALGSTYEEGNPAALKAFNVSLQLALAVDDHGEIVLSQLALAEYYYARQDHDQARNFLKQAQERLSYKLTPYLSGFVQRLAGRLKAVEGTLSEAAQHIVASISIFTTVGERYEIARSHLELSAVLAKSESFEKARTHLKQAKEVFRELDAHPSIDRARLVEDLIERHLSLHGGAAEKTEIISDAALLKRMGQACITAEILMREFSEIAFEALRLRKLIIFQTGSQTQALSVERGANREDVEALRALLRKQPCEDRRLTPNGLLVKLSGAQYSDVYIYLESLHSAFSQSQLERVDLFLEFAKLGLENCALRAGAPAEIISSGEAVSSLEPNTLIQGFVYSSSKICRVVEHIKKIRTSDVTVLITGESGTGKELVARAIHAESTRCEGAFVAFNCTATPRELIESQLFGHRRGSFTGATSNYLGVIRTAKGGTLFLDEIGDLSLELQPKLLRFLEAGEIQPLGEGRPLKVDVRVIAATNADLARVVAERRFREDLYHRLNIIRIHIPPLRERPEEIPMLIRYYLEYFAARYGDKQISFPDSVVEMFQRYYWPGNVRQLRNELERIVTYSGKGDVVSISDLSPDIRNSMGPTLVAMPLKALSAAAESVRSADASADSPRKLRDVVRPIEKRMILSALERNGGNFSQTAKELGMSRRGLRLKIDSLGINVAE